VAAAKILTLIDKVDNVELVRDQIAAVLLVESASQQQLASDIEKDSRLWALRVFTEASNPWEQFRKAPDGEKGEEPADYTPIVNVWFDQAATDRSSSSQVNRKKVDATFQIDCYGYGISRSDGGGQAAGDTGAALEAQRAARLVRNILESAHYVNLGLVKLVGDRVVQSIQSMQLPQGSQQAQHVVCVRLTLNASFNEFSPQYDGQPFEGATITITRDPSGEVSVFDFNASTP
jgi:hypothetical protein